jgi:tetratricopeptide (TPR) repeat protein
MDRLNKARKNLFFRSYSSSLENDSQDYVPPKKVKGYSLPPLKPSDEEKMNKLKEKMMAKSKGGGEEEVDEIELEMDDLDGISPQTLVMKAIRKLSQHKTDEAILYLEKCIEKHPGLNLAHTAMGHAYRGKGDLTTARSHFQKSIGIDSKCVDAMIGLANVDILEKNYEDAMRTLTEALKLDENYATTLSTFGVLYEKMGEPKEAIKYHKKALTQKDINDPQAYSILGELLAREGHFEDSIEYLNKSIKIDPNFGSGYIALILLHLELLNWRLCEEYVTNLLKITQSKVQMKKQLGHTDFMKKVIGLIQYLAGKGKDAVQCKEYELAIKLSELCLILKPKEEELLILNALSLFKANKLDEAIAKLTILLKIYPKSYRGLTMMSEIKEQLGEHAEAFKYLMKAQNADKERARIDQNIS